MLGDIERSSARGFRASEQCIMMVGKAAVAKYPEPCCLMVLVAFLQTSSEVIPDYLPTDTFRLVKKLCFFSVHLIHRDQSIVKLKKYCEPCMIGLSLLILVDCKACDIESLGMMSFNFIPYGHFFLSRVQPTWRSMLL
jgi:hypothetical protein